MSRRHKAVRGDTYIKLAIQYYSDWSKWKIISDANKKQGIYTIQIGANLIIPDASKKEDKEDKKKEEAVKSKRPIVKSSGGFKDKSDSKENVMIEFKNGDKITKIDNFNYNSGLGYIADIIKIGTPTDLDQEEANYYVKEKCSVYIKGDKILEGEVVGISINRSERETHLTMTIKSLTYKLEGETFRGGKSRQYDKDTSIHDLINSLLEPLEFDVKYDSELEQGLKSTKLDKNFLIQYNKKLADIINDIAKDYKFIISSDKDGNLSLIDTSELGKEPAIQDIDYEFMNFISLKANVDVSKVPKTLVAWRKGGNRKAEDERQEMELNIVKNSTIVKIIETTSNNLQRVLESERGRIIGDYFNWILSLSEYQYESNKIYKKGQIIKLKAKDHLIDDYKEFLIKEVKILHTTAEVKCDLTLVPKEAYRWEEVTWINI